LPFIVSAFGLPPDSGQSYGRHMDPNAAHDSIVKMLEITVILQQAQI
jgi:hypothetical protein